MKSVTLIFLTLLFSFSATISAQTVSLGNRVWWDLNDNGIRDSGEPNASSITVNLYLDNNDDGIADAGFTPLTTTTDGNGKYLFSGLAPGKYFIMVDAGYSHFVSARYGGDPDNDINNDNNGYSQNLASFYIYSQTITLNPGEEPDGTGATNTNTNNTLDVGMWKANGLGDLVWLDNNANGIQDTGEPGLPNVTVNLKNASGSILETTTTDANGNYFFYDPMGHYGVNNYQVEFVTPAGYAPTIYNSGSDDEIDSDPQNGLISAVNVPFGRWDHSFDAGFVPIELPVKWISFTAMLHANQTDLHWTTAGEFNVSHFVIEKSRDGANFSEAGVVFANGNTTDNSNYSFSDNVSGIQSGIVYYRLRSVDIDGKSQYSETRIIKIETKSENYVTILTYPNPASNELRITVPANWQNKRIIYELVNTNGQVTKKIETAASSQTETLSVSNLAPGFYVVRVSCDGQTAQQKIVKQ